MPINPPALKPQPAAIQDLLIKRGESINLTVTFSSKATGTPTNWTGWTFTSQVRKSDSKTSPLVVALTVTAPTPTNGGLLIVLSAANSASIDEGEYQYDVYGTNGSQARYPLEGKLTVEGRITKS